MTTLRLPFVVLKVEAWGDLPRDAWAVVQRGATDEGVFPNMDVSIVDTGGRVALRMSGITLR